MGAGKIGATKNAPVSSPKGPFYEDKPRKNGNLCFVRGSELLRASSEHCFGGYSNSPQCQLSNHIKISSSRSRIVGIHIHHKTNTPGGLGGVSPQAISAPQGKFFFWKIFSFRTIPLFPASVRHIYARHVDSRFRLVQ